MLFTGLNQDEDGLSSSPKSRIFVLETLKIHSFTVLDVLMCFLVFASLDPLIEEGFFPSTFPSAEPVALNCYMISHMLKQTNEKVHIT